MVPLKALVVDDSAPMREAMKEALRAIGECSVVGEGADGLEVLAGVLSGASLTTRIGKGTFAQRDQNPWGIGHLLLAVDIGTFTDVAEFKANIDSIIEEFKNSPKRPGFEEIFVPGEIEWNRVEGRRCNGIPVHENLLRELQEIAHELEMEFPAVR
ncbi:MAG: Ldh family oxidoreductase [Chloroflexi bacterium]|nr:Ldh family oxidoreductase [Chloroflexota bacterium]